MVAALCELKWLHFCHLVCDAFQASFITPQYIRSSVQLVDIFTKALQLC